MFTSVATIRMALEFNIPQVVPSALYDICRVTEFTSSGGRDLDHTIDIESLPPEFLCKIILGRSALKTYICHRLSSMLYNIAPYDYCTRMPYDSDEDLPPEDTYLMSPCSKKVFEFRRSTGFREEVQSRDVFAHMKGVIDKASHVGMCSGCEMVVVEELRKRRETLWKALPDIFQIVSYCLLG